MKEAVHVYRLYQKQGSLSVNSPAGDSPLSSVLNPLRSRINAARTIIREGIGELQGKLLVKEFRVPLIVQGLDKLPEVRTSFSYLQDGYFLDTPFPNAKGVTHFRIRGCTHWRPVLVNGVAVDGDAALKEFAELIDDYFFPANGRVTSDFDLYFLDLMAPVSAEDPFGETEWLIHPLRNGVRQTQSAQRPFIRQWQFDFVGLQSNRDKAKAEDGFLSSLGRGFLGKLLDGLNLGGVVAAVQEVFGTIDDVKGLFDDVGNAVTAVTDYVQGVQDTIRLGIGKVRGVMTGIQTVIGRIEDGIDLIKNLPDVISNDLSLLAKDFPGLSKSKSSTPGVVAIDELRRVRDFMSALAAQPRLFAPELGDSTYRRSIAVAVQPGATIEELAREHSVSVEDLIRLNQLSYPFVESRPRPDRQLAAAEIELEQARNRHEELSAALSAMDPGAAAADIAHLEYQTAAALARFRAAEAAEARWAAELAASPVSGRVLYAGDAIRIPQPSLATPPSIVEMHPALEARTLAITGAAVDDEDRLFGLDLALDDDGNLVWDDDAKDVAIERGLLHMARVQVRYVRLPLGALRYAAGIGNFAYENLGMWQGQASNQLLAFAMFQTLRQDPRVEKVRNVQAITHAGVASLQHDIDLINGRTVSEIRVPVP